MNQNIASWTTVKLYIHFKRFLLAPLRKASYFNERNFNQCKPKPNYKIHRSGLLKLVWTQFVNLLSTRLHSISRYHQHVNDRIHMGWKVINLFWRCTASGCHGYAKLKKTIELICITTPVKYVPYEPIQLLLSIFLSILESSAIFVFLFNLPVKWWHK